MSHHNRRPNSSHQDFSELSATDLSADSRLIDLVMAVLLDHRASAELRGRAADLLRESTGTPLAALSPHAVAEAANAALSTGDLWLLDLIAHHLFADLEVPGLPLDERVRAAGLAAAEGRANVPPRDLFSHHARLLVSDPPARVSDGWVRILGWVFPHLLDSLVSSRPELSDRAERYLPSEN